MLYEFTNIFPDPPTITAWIFISCTIRNPTYSDTPTISLPSTTILVSTSISPAILRSKSFSSISSWISSSLPPSMPSTIP
jgi:hypothetical protein